MRIMMLSQFYPPIIGGEEQHVRALSGMLAARGHAVSVVTLAQPGLPRIERDGAVTVYRIGATVKRFEGLFSDPVRQFAPPLPDPEVTFRLKQLLHRERPEIVHAHNWLGRSFLPFKSATLSPGLRSRGPRLKKLSDAKLVVTLHDYSLVCATKRLMDGGKHCAGPDLSRCLGCAGRQYGALKGAVVTLGVAAMKRAEMAAVDMYIPVSRAVAEGTGLPGSGLPYQVVPNFVPDDVALRADAGSPLLAQLPAGEFILYAGDLSADKGVPQLVRAHQQLEKAPPLVLLGRRTANTPASFPANVLELGPWPREVVMAAWQRCLFGVAPSVWPDPCPSVAMEALASGRPVIASNVGGLKDIVEERSGILVPPGDVDALAGAMRRLVKDRHLRKRLGAGALARSAAFKASAVVPAVEAIYDGLLGSSPLRVPA